MHGVKLVKGIAMPTTITVADYLCKAIDLSGKTQKQIAREVGYPKPNIISMMKQGDTKIPLDKIPAFAKACGVDASAFVRLAIKEYFPEMWKVLSKTVGEPLTKNEEIILEIYRNISPNSDLEIDSHMQTRIKDALKGVKKVA